MKCPSGLCILAAALPDHCVFQIPNRLRSGSVQTIVGIFCARLGICRQMAAFLTEVQIVRIEHGGLLQTRQIENAQAGIVQLNDTRLRLI